MKRSNMMAQSVFYDLFDDPEVAANLAMRSQLMMATKQAISRRKWTQAKAAKELNVMQSRISDLMNGRIDKFSVDALINFLAILGMDVKVKVTKRRKTATA